MKHRILSGELRCLRIFVGENDKFQHQPVWKTIMEQAREKGIAGCTVLHAAIGFGKGRRLHHEMQMEGAGWDLPMLIEVVDEADRVGKFLESVKPMLTGTLVTEERAFVHHYQPSQAPTGEEK